MHKQIMLSLSC